MKSIRVIGRDLKKKKLKGIRKVCFEAVDWIDSFVQSGCFPSRNMARSLWRNALHDSLVGNMAYHIWTWCILLFP